MTIKAGTYGVNIEVTNGVQARLVGTTTLLGVGGPMFLTLTGTGSTLSLNGQRLNAGIDVGVGNAVLMQNVADTLNLTATGTFRGSAITQQLTEGTLMIQQASGGVTFTDPFVASPNF